MKINLRHLWNNCQDIILRTDDILAEIALC